MSGFCILLRAQYYELKSPTVFLTPLKINNVESNIMAERRMFAKKIISSARFLKMPMETQSLYFHLGINADDDGVVEAFSIMRQVGSSEDSLKLLSAKGFIKVLNDDLVSHIIDWTENNKIRADRKVDSIYKGLLLEIVPDVEILEPKTRSDRPTANGTTNGQPMDGIVEVRLVKDSVVEVSKNQEASAVSDYLLKRITSYNPSFNKSNSSWYSDIDKAMRLDNRSYNDLISLIDFIYTTETFWIPNILSGKKLRDKYDAIYMKMPKKQTPKQQSAGVSSQAAIDNIMNRYPLSKPQ